MNGRSRTAAIAVTMILAWGATAIASEPQRILIDDFNDGNDDGWTRGDDTIGKPWGPGTFDASSGSYQLLGGGVVPVSRAGGLYSIWDASSDPLYSEGFLRATVRANNSTTIVALSMRVTAESLGAQTNEWYWFGGNPTPEANRFWFNKFVEGNIVARGSFGTDFHVGEDWIIEAGAVGDTLSMKVWGVDEPEPPGPQWTVTDSSPLNPGSFGLSTWHWALENTPAGIVDATFDDVYFTPISPADFNVDRFVDETDLGLWETGYGYPGRRADGDADGDGMVTGADFLIWQREYATGVPGLPSEIGVPEPATVTLLAIGLATGGWLSRRRRKRE